MDHKTDDIVSTYLEMMDHQREALFGDMDGLSEELLWQPILPTIFGLSKNCFYQSPSSLNWGTIMNCQSSIISRLGFNL